MLNVLNARYLKSRIQSSNSRRVLSKEVQNSLHNYHENSHENSSAITFYNHQGKTLAG